MVCYTMQHASAFWGRICCHTEIEAAYQTCRLTQSQNTDNGPTSPCTDPIMSGAWQSIHQSNIKLSHWYDSTGKKPHGESGVLSRTCRSQGGRLTTRPNSKTRRKKNRNNRRLTITVDREQDLTDTQPSDRPATPCCSYGEMKQLW